MNVSGTGNCKNSHETKHAPFNKLPRKAKIFYHNDKNISIIQNLWELAKENGLDKVESRERRKYK
jgi:hypothetical protein